MDTINIIIMVEVKVQWLHKTTKYMKVDKSN